jgi:uncharacterized small protein (DUF1192 family)
MALFDDEPVKKPAVHIVGEDLSRLSLDELEERIALLEAEIKRIEEAAAAKRASRSSADAFFRR